MTGTKDQGGQSPPLLIVPGWAGSSKLGGRSTPKPILPQCKTICQEACSRPTANWLSAVQPMRQNIIAGTLGIALVAIAPDSRRF